MPAELSEADTWRARWQLERTGSLFLEATVHELSLGHRTVPGEPWTCRDCNWHGRPSNPYPTH